MSFFPSISNSQIQTHNSKSRFQAAVLVGAPSYPNAIAWSDENLIAVASAHLVTILNPATLPFGPRGLITIQNGPPFPIGVIDRQDLFSDCLLPTIISRDLEPCVRSISWSPVGLASNAGCLLAVCTTQGLVKLYRPPFCDFCAEWIEVVDLSSKLYDYLVSISFGEVAVSSLEQCDNLEIEQCVQSVPTKDGKRRKANKSGMSSSNPYSKIYGQEVLMEFQELESDSNQLEERNLNQIVPLSKAKVKSLKKIPENSTFPRITVDQYATRSAMLSSLVVAWSPMLPSHAKISSIPQHGSSLSLLAVGGKLGQVALWRVSVPEYYSVDQSSDPTTVLLIEIIQAHNSWVTAISWALLESDSSNPQLLMATGSYNGSVKIWLAYYEQLLKSLEPSQTSFSLLMEVATVDMIPVSALSVIVPAQFPHIIHLAVGKGSGCFEVWICNISGQKFDKIIPCDGHSQIVTGLAWAFDGKILHTCSQDNFVRCWILNGSSLCEVPIPSNTPGLRSSTDLPDGFVSCFGVAVSPGNLAIAWVRNTDVDQLNPMYEARTQKAIVEFFWIGGQQVHVLSDNLDLDTEAIPGSSDIELVDWESNILWSLKQYETQDKPLVVWDIITALLAFRRSKPEYVEHLLIKWLSIPYVGSDFNPSAENVLLYASQTFSKVTSRQLHLLNIICRRVILSEMKADEINSRLLNSGGVNGAEEELLTLWISLLLNSERELRQRLVGFTFSSFKSRMPAAPTNSQSRHWFPVGLAQMEQWVELNQDYVPNELRVLAAEVRKHERRLQSSNSIAEEKCSYCLASVPFESPEVAFCQGKGHKLARCAVSMVVCPATPIWFCMCCHRRAFKLAPETLFVVPGPQCPFCGILLQRLQPDFLLAASPT